MSVIKAVFGFIAVIAGTILLLTSVLSSAIIAFLSIFGISLPFIAPLTGVILGILMVFVGGKWLLESEKSISKFLAGLFGIFCLILGIFAVFAGFVTGGLGWIAAILLFSMGVSLIGYGFGFKILRPASEGVRTYRRAIE